MKPEEKEQYVKGLKAFDELSEDDRLKVFIQMENAKVCLNTIVEEVQAHKEELSKNYFADIKNGTHEFIKNVLDWCSVYMKAGIEAGYTVRKQNEE